MKAVMISIQPKWKDIVGYENEYQINQFGEIRTLKDSPKLKKYDVLKPQISKRNGYVYQMLYKNGKEKLLRVHRLVAMAFLPNPNNLPQVNHKDGNKQNNSVDNLEWCEQSYNMKHAFKTGLEKPSEKQKAAVRKTNEKKRKRVVRTMGDEKNEYESATVAARKNNVGISTICRYCNKKRMPKDGASWQYIEDLGYVEEQCKKIVDQLEVGK